MLFIAEWRSWSIQRKLIHRIRQNNQNGQGLNFCNGRLRAQNCQFWILLSIFIFGTGWTESLFKSPGDEAKQQLQLDIRSLGSVQKAARTIFWALREPKRKIYCDVGWKRTAWLQLELPHLLNFIPEINYSFLSQLPQCSHLPQPTLKVHESFRGDHWKDGS